MRAHVKGWPPELQQTEIGEYITAFKGSSDRARYMIFINTFVSLLILICTWNVTRWSWTQRQIDATAKGLRAKYAEQYATEHPEPGTKPAQTPKTLAAWQKDQQDFVEKQLKYETVRNLHEHTLDQVMVVPVPA